MKVAINGFGRIGRNFLRAVQNRSEIEIVAVNDLGNLENAAYLLMYDTAYGKFEGTVSVSGTVLVVNGKSIQFFSEKDPTKLPWGRS